MSENVLGRNLVKGYRPESALGEGTGYVPEIDRERIIRCIRFLRLNFSNIWEPTRCWMAASVFCSFALLQHF